MVRASAFDKTCLLVMSGSLILASPALGIRIGSDNRMTYGEFARANGLKDKEVQTLFGASVRIVCPWLTGGAALTGDGRVFVTADHVLFGVAKKAKSPSRCHVESFDGKQKFKIDPKSIIRGKSVHSNFTSNGDNDWAVGRITSTAVGIVPYRLGEAKKPGENVLAISQGQINWGGHRYPTPSVGKCRILSTSAFSDYADCDSDKGSSGATLLAPTLSVDQSPEIIGIGVWTYYGTAKPYSNKDCDDTSKCATQYVGMRGELRKAILRVLSQ